MVKTNDLVTPLGIVVAGAAGRMGQTIINTIAKGNNARVVGALESENHPNLGQTIETDTAGHSVVLSANYKSILCAGAVNAVIDFTTPASTLALLQYTANAGIVHVVGTTGFSQIQKQQLEQAGQHNVLIVDGNMSLGVNILVHMTETVARLTGQEFDIEILDVHHHHKVDAPSGTALMLGQAGARGRGLSWDNAIDTKRAGHFGARQSGKIGFASLRAGDVVGEHDVTFAASGERIVLRHIATDRAIFARGALYAALWGQDKPFGFYTMRDVLNFNC